MDPFAPLRQGLREGKSGREGWEAGAGWVAAAPSKQRVRQGRDCRGGCKGEGKPSVGPPVTPRPAPPGPARNRQLFPSMEAFRLCQSPIRRHRFRPPRFRLRVFPSMEASRLCQSPIRSYRSRPPRFRCRVFPFMEAFRLCPSPIRRRWSRPPRFRRVVLLFCGGLSSLPVADPLSPVRHPGAARWRREALGFRHFPVGRGDSRRGRP